MALVPRSVEDTPGRGGVLMRWMWPLLALPLIGGPATAAIDVDLTRYTDAERTGAAVAVTGRVISLDSSSEGSL